MPTSRLAIAIPSFNRASMLDAILRELAPPCAELGIPILVSDNGSKDETPAVCARWAADLPGFRFQRHPETVPLGNSIMSAMEMSDADYTWLSGDDDYLVPAGIRAVHDLLASEEPSALVVGTMEVPAADSVALDRPIGPQVASVLAAVADRRGRLLHEDAAAFFAAKHYRLPMPSVVYRTDRTRATDYARYLETHHSHIGGLFDALAAEQAERGRVDVVELLDVCSVSLTVHHDRGKENWTELFRFLGVEGFPRWFAMLPAIYQPHLPDALAFHRHVFRAVLGDAGGASPAGGR